MENYSYFDDDKIEKAEHLNDDTLRIWNWLIWEQTKPYKDIK